MLMETGSSGCGQPISGTPDVCRGSFCATGEHPTAGTAAGYGERNERACRVKSISPTDDQSDPRVDRLDQGIREPVLQRGDEGFDVLYHSVGHIDKWLTAESDRPVEPRLEQLQCVGEGELKDEPQMFREEVGTIQRLVDALALLRR